MGNALFCHVNIQPNLHWIPQKAILRYILYIIDSQFSTKLNSFWPVSQKKNNILFLFFHYIQPAHFPSSRATNILSPLLASLSLRQITRVSPQPWSQLFLPWNIITSTKRLSCTTAAAANIARDVREREKKVPRLRTDLPSSSQHIYVS